MAVLDWRNHPLPVEMMCPEPEEQAEGEEVDPQAASRHMAASMEAMHANLHWLIASVDDLRSSRDQGKQKGERIWDEQGVSLPTLLV